MAEAKPITQKTVEKEYIIPLRRECSKVAHYEKTKRAVKAIKKFVAKHMKVPDRDLDKVKLDVYLNNEIWFKGRRKPPAKIKVKVHKEGDIVRVEFSEIPEHVKFLKAKQLKVHKKAEKPKAPVKAEEKKPEEKTEEEKKEEEEKGKSVEEQHVKEAEMAQKAQKHTVKEKIQKQREPQQFRKALKK